MWPSDNRKHNTGVPLTQAVRDKIGLVFADGDRQQAADLIQNHCGSGLPLMDSMEPDDYDRIRFAVIKLSNGGIGSLRKRIDEANTDWRDVLVGAGFAWDETAHLRWHPESDKPTQQ